MVTGLWGAGLPTDDVTVAGDLVLYSKYQMLVGNAQALDRLSEQQRAYLDEIVAAAHAAALGRHFTEADLAAELCARPVAGWSRWGRRPWVRSRRPPSPLTDALRADPVTGELMAAVEALGEETPVSPGAGTCEPGQAVQPSIAPSGPASELPVPGVWRINHTVESLVDMGVTPQRAPQIAGSVTMTLDGARWDFIHSTKDGDFPCGGTYALDGDDLVLTFEINPRDCGTEPVRLQWIASGPDTPPCGRSTTSTSSTASGRASTARCRVPAAAAFIGDQPVPAGTYRIVVTLESSRRPGRPATSPAATQACGPGRSRTTAGPPCTTSATSSARVG